MTNQPLLLTNTQPKEVSAAASLIPYRRDDDRAKYLGYLCCGFSDEEALYVLGLNRTWLKDARSDSKFTELEERVPELRKQLSREYTELDFYRNFRMVLEQDHRVLRKSLGMELEEDESGELVPAQLTSFEQQYLLRLRSAYTSQQLQLLEAISAGSDGGFNFAQWVSKNQDIVQISRTDTISLARGQGGKKTSNS